MKFTTTLLLHGKTATGFEVPTEEVEALGAGKKPPVKVTINGYTYRSSVAVMGGKFLCGVAALKANPSAKAAFEKLLYSYKRAHVEPIAGSKAADTRQRRIDKMITMLSEV